MALSDKELGLLKKTFLNNKKLRQVILFGSRAKGTETDSSDIDLAVLGLDTELDIEALAMELEDLPLPYKIDVKAFETIRNAALRSHIERVGIVLYDKKSLEEAQNL